MNLESNRPHEVGDDTCRAARAIAVIEESGKVAVEFHPMHRPGPWFCAHWLRADGRPGLSIGRGAATEPEAWLSAAIELAEYKPGVLQMTSREFGSTRTANVLCQDGSLGTLERRSRLEIREVAGQFEVFLLCRRYLHGEEPRDTRQYRQDVSFASLTDAAGFVGQFMADFEGAAADDRDAAIQAQREREREDSSGNA